MIGMMEGACGAFWRKVQTEELRQSPWAMMSCSWTLLSNARVALERLKVWKPWPLSGMFLCMRIFLSASRMWVSMTWLYGEKLLANRGDEGGRGQELSNVLRASTGQRK